MTIYKKIAMIVFVAALIVSCGSLHSNKVDRDGISMLYGEISPESLFMEFPLWQDNYDAYTPNPETVANLANFKEDLKVEIFLGTWCEDSRREVPAFLKIADVSGFVSPENIHLWAVDRQKHLENGLAESREIELVATFIFLKNDNEIGRIIEMPDNELLETDILQILEKK